MNQTSLRHAATVNIHPGSYVVNSMPRGFVLIINNEKYTLGEGGERRGSTLDAARLRRLFEEFSYHVSVHNDCTAADIRKAVEDFSKKKEFKYVDAAIVVILAHGSNGVIVDSDHDEVSIMELLENFNTNKCVLLAGKPKFFIFQACRGRDNEDGYIFSKGAQRDSQICSTPQEKEIASPTAYQPRPDTQSSFSDYLIAYPTVQGYAAWRTQDNGSPFIRRLEEVFRSDSRHEQVLDMLYAVSRYIADEPVMQSLTGERHFQTSQIESTLRKPFYFWTDDLLP